MTRTLRIALLSLALAITVGLTSAHAASDGRRATFRRDGSGHVARIVIRNGCIDQEDSAGHLILRAYGNGRAVFGCDPDSF
jgi:hypothetical protein